MRCDWNPERNSRGIATLRWRTGCENEATWMVGVRPVWKLCDSCAALPRFRHLKDRDRIPEPIKE
jgi:hypothetical protein